ncbi:MAG: radical SAM protein [Treponema sp.]|jgi:DNA repair photolyase|nr:radical SAM protein [Treponema sp.]
MTITEYDVKTILTKTRIPAGDYVINPYIGCPHKCIYCYADFMRRFTQHKEKWGDFLEVKRYNQRFNIPALRHKKIVFSSVTDAYNPYERTFCVTRGLLRQFMHTEVKIEILTKSDLVLRDRDIFKYIPNIRIGISLNTLDDSIRKALEPHAPSVNRRLNAIKLLHDEGLDTYIFLSPIFPGITDFKEILRTCKTYTNQFYFENLNLRGAFRPIVLQYIRDNHKALVSLYDEIYKYNTIEYWQIMEKEIGVFCREQNIQWGSYFYHEKIRK